MVDEHETLRLYDTWLVTAEAVNETGYSAEYLHTLAQEQRVTAVKLGGRWFFDRESLLAFKAEIDALREPKRNHESPG